MTPCYSVCSYRRFGRCAYCVILCFVLYWSWAGVAYLHRYLQRQFEVLSIDCGLLLLDITFCVVFFPDWDGLGDHDRVHRQLSVSSDSKLLDEDIREEARVILRPKKPPRPKSEVFLNKEQQRRTKRYSAFGVSPCASPQRPGGGVGWGVLLFTIRELFANGRWIIISFPSGKYTHALV